LTRRSMLPRRRLSTAAMDRRVEPGDDIEKNSEITATGDA
jgi:hypothetical protein